MLYVEKMTHEVGGTGIGIRAFHELINLLFSVRHPTMRLLDQDAFETLGHTVTYQNIRR
jgi:hypothetical protein